MAKGLLHGYPSHCQEDLREYVGRHVMPEAQDKPQLDVRGSRAIQGDATTRKTSSVKNRRHRSENWGVRPNRGKQVTFPSNDGLAQIIH